MSNIYRKTYRLRSHITALSDRELSFFSNYPFVSESLDRSFILVIVDRIVPNFVECTH